MNKFVLLLLAALTCFISACDNGILIGEDLLDDEEIGTVAREDFGLSARTLAGKQLNTLVASRDNRAFPIGTFDDPIFGKSSSDAYFGLTYAGLPNFRDAVADSIVLVFQYDTLGVFGDTLATHEIMVHRVTEDFLTRDSIDSEETISFDPSPIATKTFVPNYKDSITLLSRAGVTETIKVPAQLRITLDTELAAELLGDSTAAMSDTSLQQALKGFHITAKSNDKSILSLRFDDASFTSVNLYYTQADTAKRIFTYPLEREVFSNIQHDYAGAPVEQFIDSDVLGDSLIFSQSLKGVDPEISFLDIATLKEDVIINKAVLVLTVAELPGDLPIDLYPITTQLLASRLNDNERRVLIQDLVKTGSLDEGLVIFGGNAAKVEQEDGTVLTQYRMNITDYIKDAVKNNIANPKIILTPFFRQESPRNTVIYGPGHSTYPAKLRITYTEL